MGLAVVLVVVAGVVELAALPLATRLAGSALEGCLHYDDLEVEAIDRPVLPGLLVGRARDVELTATGVRSEEIRVERARLELPEVALPWAIRPPPRTEATLGLELAERDLQEFLAERIPLGLEPVLELTPGVAALGIEPLPARVPLQLEVREGVLRVTPAGERAGWFESLGLDLELELPDDVELDRLEIRRGALTATLRVEVVPGTAGPAGCP